MNFYKHFIGDYQRDTAHLSLNEHGAFRLMLDSFYATARPLPAERKALYRLIRAETEPEKRAVDAVVSQFWRPLPSEFSDIYSWLNLRSDADQKPLGIVASQWTDPTGLINVRALGEIVKASVLTEKNRAIAFEREERKRQQAAAKLAQQGGAQ